MQCISLCTEHQVPVSTQITYYLYLLAELMHELSSVRSTPTVESEHSREVSESRVMSMSTGERITKLIGKPTDNRGEDMVNHKQLISWFNSLSACTMH